jgi:hypothetical protein
MASETDKEAGSTLSEEEKWAIRTRPLRFKLFIGLLALLAAYLIAGQYWSALAVCRNVPVSGGVQEVCEPPRTNSIWPIILVAFIPLLPDLGSISIAGILDLKRRVLRAEESSDLAKEQVDEIAETVLEQVWERLPGDIAKKSVDYEAQAEQGLNVSKAIDTHPPPAPESDAVAAGELLEEWGLLSGPWQLARHTRNDLGFRSQALDYLALPPNERPPIDHVFRNGSDRKVLEELPDANPETLAAIERWASLFDREILTVRQTRNAVAHPPHRLSASTISEAVEAAQRLRETLKMGINLSYEP